MMLRTVLIVATCALITGCGPKSQSFDVAVRNSTKTPLTVWLTKRGQAPVEAQWLSPEDVAIHGTGKDKRIPGIVVQPGEARGARLDGKFPSGSTATLRIYRGKLTLDEILAAHNADGRFRLDVALTPGLNHLVVSDTGGALSAERSARFSPTTRPGK